MKYDAGQCQTCNQVRPLTTCNVCDLMICWHCKETKWHTARVDDVRLPPEYPTTEGKVA